MSESHPSVESKGRPDLVFRKMKMVCVLVLAASSLVNWTLKGQSPGTVAPKTPAIETWVAESARSDMIRTPNETTKRKVSAGALSPGVTAAAVTIVSGAKQPLDTYNIKLMRGSELLWEKTVGSGEKWESGYRFSDTVRFSGSREVLFESIEGARVIISKDPYTNPLATPLVEVVVFLTNGKSILVLPRSTTPDTSFVQASMWEWQLKMDPFGLREDKDDAFGNGDTVHGLTLGGSFDFLDKLKLDNVYSSINVFAPRLWKITDRLNVGLDAGFFQNRSNALSLEDGKIDRYRVNDTVGVVALYSDEMTKKTDNLGLYLNPTVKLTDGLYAFLNLEFRRRSITTTSKYSKVSSDTSRISRADSTYAQKADTKFSNPVPKQSVENDLLVGPGVTASFENRIVSFEVSAFGSSNLRGELGLVFQFDLLIKKSDLILGGEVRDRRPFTSQSSKEFIIYLAKYLPITAVSDFFTGK